MALTTVKTSVITSAEERDRYEEVMERYRKRKREMSQRRVMRYRSKNPERYREVTKRANIKYRAKNLQKCRALTRRSSARLRQRGIDSLGGKCVHYGCSNASLLTFGHIRNDGAEHRKIFGSEGSYRDWDRRGWPRDEVELQCYNYNLGGACR